MHKLKFTIAFLLLVLLAGAQTNGPEMADNFRSEGKIYVVITVIALIFAAIVFFLVYLDRKVSRLEKKLGEDNNSTTPRH